MHGRLVSSYAFNEALGGSNETTDIRNCSLIACRSITISLILGPEREGEMLKLSYQTKF